MPAVRTEPTNGTERGLPGEHRTDEATTMVDNQNPEHDVHGGPGRTDRSSGRKERSGWRDWRRRGRARRVADVSAGIVEGLAAALGPRRRTVLVPIPVRTTPEGRPRG
jgi:hypothetical protein